MKIKGYSDNEIELIRATTNPIELMELATNITMQKNFETAGADNIEKRIKYLIDANHTSPFEHVKYTFMIKGATRSFLAQITRHRMASYTSGSQHYQDYSDYGFRITDKHKDNSVIDVIANNIMDGYKRLMEMGVPNYEARQILPMGMENNLMVTMNARSLGNFFNLRLCNRNTDEIKSVAEGMYRHCVNHFPEYFRHIGPDCHMDRYRQGPMYCGKKWNYNKVIE
jgi:thymidylate synthase (FAD)